jgi:hypothetical protein
MQIGRVDVICCCNSFECLGAIDDVVGDCRVGEVSIALTVTGTIKSDSRASKSSPAVGSSSSSNFGRTTNDRAISARTRSPLLSVE